MYFWICKIVSGLYLMLFDSRFLFISFICIIRNITFPVSFAISDFTLHIHKFPYMLFAKIYDYHVCNFENIIFFF